MDANMVDDIHGTSKRREVGATCSESKSDQVANIYMAETRRLAEDGILSTITPVEKEWEALM